MEKVSHQLSQQGQPHKVAGGRVEDTQAEGKAEWPVTKCRQWWHLLVHHRGSVGLQSNQEEADTRVILLAAHAAAEGYRPVVVTAGVIDVMVLCFAFSAGISCSLFQKCGTKTRIRYIDINNLRHGLEGGVRNYLIGMRAYTGCNTVGAFAGQRSSEPWSSWDQSIVRKCFASWDSSWNDPWTDSRSCKHSDANCTHDPDPRQQWTSTQPARHQLFCARCGELESTQLPPCDDRLFMHTIRANYQAGICIYILQQHPQVPT